MEFDMKKGSMRVFALLAVCALAACGSGEEGKKLPDNSAAAGKAAEKPKPKPNAPIEDALAKIPPELRNDFQSALQCEVKKSEKAIQITPEYIADLFGRLKANPGIAKC